MGEVLNAKYDASGVCVFLARVLRTKELIEGNIAPHVTDTFWE